MLYFQPLGLLDLKHIWYLSVLINHVTLRIQFYLGQLIKKDKPFNHDYVYLSASSEADRLYKFDEFCSGYFVRH